MTKYPDAPRRDTLEVGLQFQDFVVDTCLKEWGKVIQCYSSRKYQLSKGESVQGVEIKYDDACSRTLRLSIEVAERTDESLYWFDSGIFGHDRASEYIQGNYATLFLFERAELVRFFEDTRPEVIEPRSKGKTIKTIRVFRMGFAAASRLAVARWKAPGHGL